MRKIVLQHDAVRNQIGKLVGEEVRLSVNRGRKRISKYSGTLISAHPAVFTVKVDNVKSADVLTYSYSDVVCGDVKVKRRVKESPLTAQ